MKVATEYYIIPIAEVQVHAEAEATPIMSKPTYEALKEDIAINGQIDPVITYRGKIIDGRHRYLILQELKEPTIKATKLPNNTTLEEIRSMVHSKEIRRHETAAQLAIRAHRLKTAPNSNYKSFAAAAKAVGANVKRVSEANQIITVYGRRDILDTLFSGRKLEIGTHRKPFQTDSLPTILRWLEETSPRTAEDVPDIQPREILTENEHLIVSRLLNVVAKESNLVQKELANKLYAMAVAGEE